MMEVNDDIDSSDDDDDTYILSLTPAQLGAYRALKRRERRWHIGSLCLPRQVPRVN